MVWITCIDSIDTTHFIYKININIAFFYYWGNINIFYIIVP